MSHRTFAVLAGVVLCACSVTPDRTAPPASVPVVVAADPSAPERGPAPTTRWIELLGASPFDAALAIAPLGDGSVVLSTLGTSAFSSRSAPDAFALRRLDRHGSVRWSRTFAIGAGNAIELARRPLAVSSDGTIVLAMAVGCGPECPDVGLGPVAAGGAVIAFTETGAASWQRATPGVPSSVDAKESTIALGISEDALAPPRVLLLRPDGSIDAELSIARRGTARRVDGRLVRSPSVAVLPCGDVVVGDGASLRRLRRSGDEVWSRTLLGVAEIDLVAASAAVIAVAVVAEPSPPDLVAAFDPDGSLRWATSRYANALAVRDDGAVAVTSSSLVEQLDVNGKPVWARTFPYLTPPHEGTDSRDGDDVEAGVTFAADGSVLACGWALALTDVGLGPTRLEGGFVIDLSRE